MTKNEIYHKAIYELQLFLRAARLEYPQLPELKADGIYGPETREAVGVFQEAVGLPVTGEADQTTWENARELYYRLLLKTADPQALKVFCMEEPVEGDEGDHIYVIQVMLRTIGRRYGQFSGVRITGILDEATLGVLRELWSVVDMIPGDTAGPGTVPMETIKLLCWLYNAVRMDDTEGRIAVRSSENSADQTGIRIS